MDRMRDLLASVDQAGTGQASPGGDPPHEDGGEPVSGRARSEVSAWRYEEVWWYLRRDFSQRAIARKLKISGGTVSYYKRRGIPPYDQGWNTDQALPDDLLTDSELWDRQARQARTTNVRQTAARQPGSSHVSRTPGPSEVTSLDERRRRT
jgi:hypothetical protein